MTPSDSPRASETESKCSICCCDDPSPETCAGTDKDGHAPICAYIIKLERSLHTAQRAEGEVRAKVVALIEAHRGWCNYCQGREDWCLATPPGGCTARDLGRRWTRHMLEAS